MKANELRIGNIINTLIGKTHGQKDMVIVEINHLKHIQEGNEFGYTPIILTEEWLLKFGFEADDEEFSRWFNKKYFANIQNSEQVFSVNTESHASCIGDDEYLGYIKPEIKYVHQLQNLYFALTGEELTI